MSHLNFSIAMSSLKVLSMGGLPAICAWLNSVVVPLYVCTLCVVPSALRTSIVWPATMPWTRGRYMHSLCSITAFSGGAAGGGAFTPLLMRTRTFFSVLLGLTTTVSSVIGVLLQKGSAARFCFGILGAVPVKATVPLMLPAAPVGAAVGAPAGAPG